MDIRKKTTTAVIWSAAQGWGGQLIAFVVYALLARYLEPRDFGLVAMAGVFIAFTQVFVDQGLSIAIVQRDELTASHLDTAFWTNIGAGLGLAALCAILAKFIGALYQQPELVPVLQVLSLVLLINSFCSVQSSLLRRRLEYKPLATATLSGTLSGGIVGVGMAISGYGIWSLVGQQLTARSVQLIMLWVAQRLATSTGLV